MWRRLAAICALLLWAASGVWLLGATLAGAEQPGETFSLRCVVDRSELVEDDPWLDMPDVVEQ